MDKTNPSAVLSKTLISEALFLLMRKKHLDEITIKELTEKAQVARRTFYQHFENKYDVMEFRVNVIFKEYVKELEESEINSTYDFGLIYFKFFKRYAVDIAIISNYGYVNSYLLKFYKRMFANDKKLYKLFSMNEHQELTKYNMVYRYGGITFMLIEWIQNNFKESPEVMAKLWAEEFGN